MKANLLDINGKNKGSINLPKCFSQKVREDVIFKVLESRKSRQPYGPSPVAGKQHSASGKIIHRRHVWKSGYGRGASRIPRKVMTRKGSQFNWVGAEISSVRGGRRAHPPKVISMINNQRVNKKEVKLAFCSALSATTSPKEISKRYETLKDQKIENLPLIVESKLTSLKTKQLIASVEKILGKQLFGLALQKKSIRSGKGKRRGRKYKQNAGLLIVIGKEEKLKSNSLEILKADKIGVTDLAKGGPGRLTLYTEQSIKELGEKLK